MNKPFACGRCFGSGSCSCDSCGGDTDCDECQGTGIDLDKVDYAAFRSAVRPLWKKHGGAAWDLVENGEVVGRAGGELGKPPAWQVRYADFPPEGAPDAH